jgi:hypothetical protein
MSSEPPPLVICNTYNFANWNTPVTFTKAQANTLYLKKTVNDTSTGKPSFTNGLLSNDYDILNPTDRFYVGQNSTNQTYVQIANDQCNSTDLFNVSMNRMEVHGQRQLGVNLTNWNVYSIFNPTFVNEYQEIIGFSITPTLNANDFYPASGYPIIVANTGLYNFKASFQFTATAISGTSGIIAFGVTTSSSSATNWLYANNGNLTGSLFRNHVPPTITTADLPINYNIDFNFVANGSPHYFKYYIQHGSGSVTGGSLIVSYFITKLC